MLYNTGEGHQLIAEIVQETWKQSLGIECRLENQEWAVFLETKSLGNFQVARGGWIIDFADPVGLLAIFETGHPYNDSGFHNPEYDKLIATARSTSGEEHFEALYRAQELLMREVPFIPIYHYNDYYLSHPRLKDWTRSTLGTLDFSRASIVSPDH